MKKRDKRRPRGHGGRELRPVQEQLLVREQEVAAGEVSPSEEMWVFAS